MNIISSERAAAEENDFIGQIYDEKISQKRVIRETFQTPRQDRRILGCVKQVYGGAFSGHNKHWAYGEEAIGGSLEPERQCTKSRRRFWKPSGIRSAMKSTYTLGILQRCSQTKTLA
jgi:hypothetical protein